MIPEWVDGISERISKCASRSTVTALSLKISEREPVLFFQGRSEKSRPKSRKAHQAMMKKWEESIFSKSIGWVFRRILESSADSVGLFLLAAGSMMLAATVLGEIGISVVSLFLPITFLFLSVPLLGGGHSCASLLRDGLFLRAFFFSYCRLPEPHITAGEGRRHPLLPIFFGALIGGISFFAPVWLVPAFLLVPLLTALFFALPELYWTLVLSALPFFHLLSHPSLILLGVSVLGGLVLFGKLLTGRREISFGRTDLLILFFVGLYLLNAFLTGEKGVTEGLLRSLLIFLAWLSGRSLMGSRHWRYRAVFGLFLSAGVCAAAGVLEYALGRAPNGWVDTTRFADLGGRACSFFENPNVLASFLLLTLPLGFCLFRRGRPMQNLICGMVLAISFACLILTWSRGAWLGILMALFLFVLLLSKRSLSLLLLLPLPAFLFVSYLPNRVLSRFLSIGSLAESSARYRVYTWKGVTRMLVRNPFGVGVGEQAFRESYLRHALSGTETVMHTHQIFLQIWSEVGVVGLMVFLWILLRLICRTVGFCRREKDPLGRREGIVLTSMLFGFLVMGLFDYVWYQPSVLFLFWWTLALAINLMRESEQKNDG
jgi:O-antigen ligase